MAVIDLANPTRFLRLVEPRAAVARRRRRVISVRDRLYAAFNAPDDYQQGATVKIMYCTCPPPGSA